MNVKNHNPDKIALVIGASSSIGESVCTALLREHNQVIGTYHSSSLDFEYRDLISKNLDITDSASRSKLIASLEFSKIELDTVVMLSGAIVGCSLSEYTDELAYQSAAINFVGQGLILRDLLPLLSKPATIILVSSIAAERGSFDPFYAASKGAMLPFAKSLATLKGQDIAVITVLPGPIEESSMFNEMSPEVQDSHRLRSPRDRLLQSTELADVIADLCEPHWRHANGAVLRLNGGVYV